MPIELIKRISEHSHIFKENLKVLFSKELQKKLKKKYMALRYFYILSNTTDISNSCLSSKIKILSSNYSAAMAKLFSLQSLGFIP